LRARRFERLPHEYDRHAVVFPGVVALSFALGSSMRRRPGAPTLSQSRAVGGGHDLAAAQLR
jgi:hypothetical protein